MLDKETTKPMTDWMLLDNEVEDGKLLLIAEQVMDQDCHDAAPCNEGNEAIYHVT